MESHQIIQENLKETRKIREELCCIKEGIDETNELLGGGSTDDSIAHTELLTIGAGLDDDVLFADPVECVEIKIKDADNTTVLTFTTTPPLDGGNGMATMFANDYTTFCFSGVKISSVNIQNNSSGTVTYIANGISG